RILKDATQELHSELITKATHDIVGVSLAFNSVQDISAELDRTTNVISKIEVFLEDLKTQQIK
ncbi:16186_t:CDS:2, partial [Racocetra fulgida]